MNSADDVERAEPVGRCIYCDATDDLSKEHIVPEGLNGRWLLPLASCAACRDITSEVERALLRGLWWPLRAALEFRTKKNHQGHPAEWEVAVQSGHRTVLRRVSTADLPLVVPFYIFNEPTEVSGALPQFPGPGAVARGVDAWFPRRIELSDQLVIEIPEHKGLAVQSRATLPIPSGTADEVARLVAKIGLAASVAEFGLDAFETIYVRDLIRGDVSEASRWFGGSTLSMRVISRRSLGNTTGVELSVRTHGVVVCLVQFFRQPHAMAQPPIYQVVVGRLRQKVSP